MYAIRSYYEAQLEELGVYDLYELLQESKGSRPDLFWLEDYMTPLEKTEQLIEKGQADLNDVREKISELKEKEKAIISRNT